MYNIDYKHTYISSMFNSIKPLIPLLLLLVYTFKTNDLDTLDNHHGFN